MPVVNAASLAHEGGMTPSLADVPLKQVMQAVGSETEFASNLPFCGIRLGSYVDAYRKSIPVRIEYS